MIEKTIYLKVIFHDSKWWLSFGNKWNLCKLMALSLHSSEVISFESKKNNLLILEWTKAMAHMRQGSDVR